MVRVFANSPEVWVQSQAESYQRLKKMVLDGNLLNTQHYKVSIKGKVEQSRERSRIEKGVFRSPSTKVGNFYLLTFSSKIERLM